MLDFSNIISDLEARRAAIDDAIVTLRNLQAAWNPPCATAAIKRKPDLWIDCNRPCATVATKDKPHQGTRRVAARRPKTTGDHESHERLSPLQDALLNVLAKSPLTSIEAHEALSKTGTSTTAGSVYRTLRLLLEKGQQYTCQIHPSGDRLKWGRR